MQLRPFSRNLMAALVLVAVATGSVLYWYFKIRPQSPTSNKPLLEESKTPEAWRSIKLNKILAEPINRNGSESVTFLAVIADNKKLVSLVSGSEIDNKIKIWDLEKGKVIPSLEGASESITNIAIDPEGKNIAGIADDKKVKVWNLKSGKIVQTSPPYSGEVKFITFSPDGKALITVSETKADKNNEKFVNIVEVWNFNDNDRLGKREDSPRDNFWLEIRKFLGKLAHKDNPPIQNGVLPEKMLDAGEGKVGAITFNPERQLLAINTQETNRVDLWDLRQKKKLTDLFVEFPEIRAIAFSKDGKRLAVSGISGGEGVVEIWNLEVNKPNDLLGSSGIKKTQTLAANTGIIDALVFSPDGSTLFTGARDRTVNIWNVSNGDLIRILSGNSAWVEALAVIPGGKPEDQRLVTGTALGVIKLWQPQPQTSSISQEVVENIRKLRGTRKCQQCNLTGADLSGFSLSQVDLQWTNLSNANLSQANLSEANLQGAILFNTDLKQAILQKANLEEANLEKANLEKANLKGANITDDRLLRRAILKGTIMPNGKVYDSQSEANRK